MHAVLRSKNKYLLTQNQDVSEWRDMSPRWLLFQWASSLLQYILYRPLIENLVLLVYTIVFC